MNLVAPPVVAYIGLGANLGDREKNIRGAADRLAATVGVWDVRRSNLHEFDAVGGPAGSPRFLNAVAELRTTLSASDLLARLLEIERQMGRERREKWGPRNIDLDLLLFARQSINSPELKVPHPHMHEREFVLIPLAELAPQARHPILDLTPSELLQKLRSAG